MAGTVTTRAIIEDLVRSTGARNPVEAIRVRARAAIKQFCTSFGDPTMPLDMQVLASFFGISCSEDAPMHSNDAELVPVENGRVAMRVNSDRPETRKRFSMAHEISHTFFPHYQLKLWCRTDARFRRRDNPDDLLEMLCDVGASELVMPMPWFLDDAAAVARGEDLARLAQKYNTSREATLRRFAETSARYVQAVFFSWKLKPTEKRTRNKRDRELLPLSEEAEPCKKLRIDYSVPSSVAVEAGAFLPPDKSVRNIGPLYSAAVGLCAEGECWLDLGPVAGHYKAMAIPLWTDDGCLGPNGENGVGAIIEPA